MNEAKPILILHDIDGTQNRLPFLPFPSPPPLKSLFNLVRRRFRIPPVDELLKPAKPKRNLIIRKLEHFWHGIRPFTKDSEKGLELLKEVIGEVSPIREIRQGVLSGRVPDLHELTRTQLRGSNRLGRYFDEGEIHLSTAASSSGFKESVGDQKLREPNPVGSLVLFEDDIAAAMRFARLQNKYTQQQVLVFLLGNISNHPLLLRWAGVKLPENVILVKSFQEGAKDLASRVRQRQI